MSTELAGTVSFSERWRALFQDQTSVRIIRFAVGVTLAVALAYGVNRPLSFLLPVLTSFILSLPIPMPSLVAGLRNMLFTLIAFGLGLVFALFFLQFPVVYMVMLGTILFHLYYYLNRGGSLWFTLMSMIAILLLSMLGNSHEGLAIDVSLNFIGLSWMAMIMIWVSYLLIPDPVFTPFPKNPGFQPGYSQPAAEAALKSTIVILPLAGLCMTFSMTDLILVMIFSALFILKPELGEGKAAGMKSLISTLLGGVYAWLFYWLIVAVPEYHFYLALTFFTTLYFGRQIFSDKPLAKYYGSALIALLILVNGSMGGDADFHEKLAMRIILITLAVIYVVVALRLLDKFWPAKPLNNCATEQL